MIGDKLKIVLPNFSTKVVLVSCLALIFGQIPPTLDQWKLNPLTASAKALMMLTYVY